MSATSERTTAESEDQSVGDANGCPRDTGLVPDDATSRSGESGAVRKRAKASQELAIDLSAANSSLLTESFRELAEKLDAEQRNALIWELLVSSDGATLDFTSATVDELRRKRQSIRRLDPVSALPSYVALKILHLVDPKSLCRCMRVCRAWRTLCMEPCLWKGLCSCERSFRMCSKMAERRQLQRHTSLNGAVRWREAFEERYRLWRSWHAGRCVVRTFHGHTQDVTCVLFDSEHIVSGSSDRTVRLWRINGGVAPGTTSVVLNGHADAVRCLSLKGNLLASGSNDFAIKLWDLAVNRTWSSIMSRKTLVGHTNTVRCLKLSNERLVSGSYDQLMKIWSIETGVCRSTLYGHSGAVLCLYCDGETLLSGSADLSIKCWDERSGAAAITLHNAHESAVTCVRVDCGRIVSASADRTVRVWDLRTGRCVHTTDWKLAEGNTAANERFMQIDAWRVISAGDDRSLKVWNLNSGERVCALQSHAQAVTCVYFDDYQIVSGSFDKTVKLWDFGVC